MKNKLSLLAMTVALTACTHHHEHHANNHAKDITDAIFTSSATNCVEYADEYISQVRDVNENTPYAGYLKISLNNDQCIFSTNAIPNHDFNDGDRTFRNPVSEQDITYTIPQSPVVNNE
jgi:hypothetical protein